jgi:hypothetical protein
VHSKTSWTKPELSSSLQENLIAALHLTQRGLGFRNASIMLLSIDTEKKTQASMK